MVIELTADDHATERLVWSTYRENNGLMLLGSEEMSDDDVDNLAGFVGFETNHLEPKERRRQRGLRAVFSNSGLDKIL